MLQEGWYRWFVIIIPPQVLEQSIRIPALCNRLNGKTNQSSACQKKKKKGELRGGTDLMISMLESVGFW